MRSSRLDQLRDYGYRYLSWPMVCLLLVMQGAAWWPMLDEQWQQQEHQWRAQQRVLSEQRRQQQVFATLAAKPLSEFGWLNTDWLAAQKRWQLHGVGSSQAWQAALLRAHELAELELHSGSWQMLASGLWQVRLEFQVHTQASRLSDALEWPDMAQSALALAADWQLLSVLSQADQHRALLHSAGQHYWVESGTWLPEVGILVRKVSAQQVVLVDHNEQILRLSVRAQEKQ